MLKYAKPLNVEPNSPVANYQSKQAELITRTGVFTSRIIANKPTHIHLCVKWHLCKFGKGGVHVCAKVMEAVKRWPNLPLLEGSWWRLGHTPPMYHLWRRSACLQLTAPGPLHGNEEESLQSHLEHFPFSHSMHTSTIAGETGCQLGFFFSWAWIKAGQYAEHHIAIMSHGFSGNFCIWFCLKMKIKMKKCLGWGPDQTSAFSYVWRKWFVGQGIPVAPPCFIYNGVLWHILALSKNCSSWILHLAILWFR